MSKFSDVTIRDFGPAGNPAGRLKPQEASGLKNGMWILEPKSEMPCYVAEQPKKSKTGKHGSAKITCKLKLGFSNKNAQLMAPGHQLLEKCVVEKNEYSFSYISEGDPEEDDLIEISCLDDNSQEVVLKLRKDGNDAIWTKVINSIAEAEAADCDVVLVTQEAPSKNKSAQNGYDIWQLVIDAKLMKEGA